MARLEIGTLCIVVGDTRAASLNGTIVTVRGHIEGARADLVGDHVIETRGGARFATPRSCLRPILPPGSSVALPRRAGAELDLVAA